MSGMIDVTSKPVMYREAVAEGSIMLKKSTIELIRQGRVAKGDVITVSRVAAILACKETSRLIPFCHPIPLTHVKVDFEIREDEVKVRVSVKTKAETGVEMEALTGVAMALLTIWDMVKRYEKNEEGLYPSTVIREIKVVSKVKRALESSIKNGEGSAETGEGMK